MTDPMSTPVGHLGITAHVREWVKGGSPSVVPVDELQMNDESEQERSGRSWPTRHRCQRSDVRTPDVCRDVLPSPIRPLLGCPVQYPLPDSGNW